MAQCVSAGLKDFPKYTDLLKMAKGKQVTENPEQAKQRLIDKVNKANGGDIYKYI